MATLSHDQSNSESPAACEGQPEGRLNKVLALLLSMHQQDPSPPSGNSKPQDDPNPIPPAVEYHQTLSDYVQRLVADSSDSSIDNSLVVGGQTAAGVPLVARPSEALRIAAMAQHVKRWELPRSDYPLGVAGYKLWRTKLNRHHSSIAQQAMIDSGYDPETKDAPLFKRVDELLLKKTLARPPLVEPLKDPEMHLFEDCICLTFLSLQFVTFSESLDDPQKMIGIVQKTWAKMTRQGRKIAVDELVGSLPESSRKVIVEALQD